MVGENSNKSKLVKNKKRGSSSFKGKSTNFSRNLRLVGVGFAKNRDIARKIVFFSRKRIIIRVRLLIDKIP